MSIETILALRETLSKLSSLQKFRMKHFGTKIYCGHETHAGWSGELPFYVFWCDECNHFTKDYPHGFEERQYLNCGFCNAYYSFVPLRVLWRELKEMARFVWMIRVKKSK